MDTALRETKEEIGIDGQHLEVICTLPPFHAGWMHVIAVTPVVALLHLDMDHLQITTNHEVEHTFWVPLTHFIINDFHKINKGFVRNEVITTDVISYTDPLMNCPHELWGLTSRICIAASSIALGTLPHFPITSNVIWKQDQEGWVYFKELAPLSHLCNYLHAHEHTYLPPSKL